MRPGGRISAAIEVLQDLEKKHRPAGETLADWGRAHRFAGSGDRAAIGNLVYDALRYKPSLAWRMGSDTPRALVLAVAKFVWGTSLEDLTASFKDDKHAPDPLNDTEIKALETGHLDEAPTWVLADIPEWLAPSFEANFSDDIVVEGQALATRPSADFRVNTLKADRQKVNKALKKFNLQETPLSPIGLRLEPTKGPQRSVNLQPEAAFQKGWLEVQDEGSQIMAQMVYAQPGEKVLDFCAGSGGKTLALAAEMNNKGQIFAHDSDRHRLAPIYERLKRAGTRNVQIVSAGQGLSGLEEKIDRVVVDAPCSGSGVWRRRPDSKWRLTPEALQKRQEEQTAVLEEAQAFVRPGGLLCYITCSVLAEENEAQVYKFLENHEAFELLSAGEVWEERFDHPTLKPWSSDDCTITLTPASTGTDGFFFAVMERKGE